jgi:hypothetical protein
LEIAKLLFKKKEEKLFGIIVPLLSLGFLSGLFSKELPGV